jgi:hypothetical protein
MANNRALAIISFLVSSGAAVAMPPQDVPAEVKSCKPIADDKERLRCFDGLFGGPSKPQKTPEEEQVRKPSEEKQANWSVDETKSPTDGSTQVVAANLVGDTVLILRCKEQTTEAAFSTQYNYLGYSSVLEGVLKWPCCICSRRRCIHSVVAGQWKTVDKDDAQH